MKLYNNVFFWPVLLENPKNAESWRPRKRAVALCRNRVARSVANRKASRTQLAKEESLNRELCNGILPRNQQKVEERSTKDCREELKLSTWAKQGMVSAWCGVGPSWGVLSCQRCNSKNCLSAWQALWWSSCGRARPVTALRELISVISYSCVAARALAVLLTEGGPDPQLGLLSLLGLYRFSSCPCISQSKMQSLFPRFSDSIAAVFLVAGARGGFVLRSLRTCHKKT